MANWTKMVEAGKATRFVKGQKPWCTGTKGRIKNPMKGRKMPEAWRLKLMKPKSKTRKLTQEQKDAISKRMSGANHPNWRNGGLRSIHDRVRTTKNYKEWRKSIYERDQYTCVMCGDKKGGNLQADHYPTALAVILYEIEAQYGKESVYDVALQYPKLWDTSNGRTVCVECHYKTDTYGGKLSHKLTKERG